MIVMIVMLIDQSHPGFLTYLMQGARQSCEVQGCRYNTSTRHRGSLMLRDSK